MPAYLPANLKKGAREMHQSHDAHTSFSGAPPDGHIADPVRLSVNLAPDVAETLKSYSRRKGVSVTESIRRAISVLAYVDAAQARGASVNIAESGKVKEVQFLV
jgi:hypothetical protein